MTKTWAAPAAAVVVLSGCSAEPAPSASAEPAASVEPAPSASASAEPAASAWPSPSHLIPGTELKAGPREGVVVGPTGALLRYVPPVSGWAPECRPASADELAAMRRYEKGIGSAPVAERGAPVAVDLPEAGWSVVAYWNTWEGAAGEVFEAAIVRGANGSASGIGRAWAGSHTYGGAAFADGPEALRVARECLGA